MFLGANISSEPQDKANLFASYFESIFINTSILNVSNFSNTQSLLDIGSLWVSEEDVMVAICSLNNSSMPDVNGICPLLLKACANHLLLPLKYLFNLSLQSGIYPDILKIGVISPVFKKGDKCNITNYRPIAKLSTFAKVFESIVNVKLSFLTKSIICDHQHGFFKGRSTLTNLTIFNKFCVDSLVSNLQVDVIYTDFAKAFDTVLHPILVAKLAALGFHSSVLMWLNSYLVSRKYVVLIEGCYSSHFTATSGVPQGSILGPLLFVLFINDIGYGFKHSNYLLYADDLKLYKVVNSPVDASLLQLDLNSLTSWCDRNFLKLNVDKCYSISLSKSRSRLNSRFKIDNINIKVVDQMLDLGVVFDSKLSFVQHLNHIIPKAFASLAIIKRYGSEFADPYTLKLLYTAFVRSKIEYASFIWNPYAQIHIRRLERIQGVFSKFALRNLFIRSTLPNYSARNLLLGLKSLESRRLVSGLIFVYDIISGNIHCSNLLEFIGFTIPTRCLRSVDIFKIEFNKVNYALNEPLARALSYYNRLSRIHCLDFSLERSVFVQKLKGLL